ncbi:ParM/StbA family protein [Alkaliphilus sp. B6464]|uniref:ParM/StbA family protein n=1 Tax=Alkaliphilus sp. B6464 TaxID=2731219 RepID=UPI001BAC839D|nr:ParM/StbA family protein [Alkaliphilus sp. B6464]QUH22121.1 ParM/StbA family protein [Alkaliphilus sp. B6464]
MAKHKIAVGIDRGFGATKYWSDLVSGHIESLVAPITEERANELMNNNKGDKSVIILHVDNEYFLVGSYVAEVEPTYAERDLRRSRDGKNETILFLAGMGLATDEVNEADLVVSTGLPTDDHDAIKDEYAKKIMNDGNAYKFTLYVGSKRFNKSLSVIKANIENQPKGTIISVINKKLGEGMSWDELKKRKFGIIDFGFNTSDASSYVGKDIVKGDKINFSTFAMVEIVATAKKLIDSNFKTKKKEDEVLKSLETCEVKVKGSFKDCSEQVKLAFEEKGNLLVNEVASKWESVIDTYDELILSGGCVANEVFANILRGLFEQHTGWDVTIPENPRMANAFGFYLISASILQNL